MDTYTLTRSGDAPLKIEADKVAESDGQWVRGRDQNRWHELAIYCLAEGRYAVSIGYRTIWQGELNHDQVYLVAGAIDVARVLREHDPTAHVLGFPEHRPEYQAKQQRLLADVRARYEEQVSELLARDEFTASPADALAGLKERRNLNRYRALLEIALREVSFSRGEAALICDACNGLGSLELYDPAGDYYEWRSWPANVEDAIRLDHLEVKWEVDAPALLEKIRALTAPQVCAVADAIEKFWEHPERDMDASLRELGLLRAIRSAT